MPKLALAAALFAGCWFAASGRCAAQPVFTNISQIRNLPAVDAEKGLPVRIQAVVTYYDPKWDTLFVHDHSGGVYVGKGASARPRYEPGQLLEIEGVTGPGFVPIVKEQTVRIVGTNDLPRPIAVSFDQLVTGREDAQWVEIEAIVRDMTVEWDRLMIGLAHGSGRFLAHLPLAFEGGGSAGTPRPTLGDSGIPTHLAGARVKVRGISAMIMNQKKQVIGARLFVPRTDYFTVVAAAPDPFSLPTRPLNSLLAFNPQYLASQRVRVAGVVSAQWSADTVFVQDEMDGLEIKLGQNPITDDPQSRHFPRYSHPALKPGDRIEAVGYPAMREYAPVLEDAEVRVVSSAAPPEPVALTVEEAFKGQYDARLISLEGDLVQVISRTAPRRERTLLVQSGERLFEAKLETDPKAALDLRPGSRVRLAGVCSVTLNERHLPRDVRLLLRSPADIVVLSSPSRWITADTLRVVWICAGVMVALLGWAVALSRRINAQNVRIKNLRAEAEMRERYRGLFTSLQDVYYRADLQGITLEVSPSCQKVLGYSQRELVGHPTSRISLFPETRDKIFKLLLERGAVEDYEILLRHKNGTTITASVNARVLRDELGEVIGTEGFVRDISARKEAEEALRESQQLLSSITHNISEGIYRSTPTKGLVYVNDAFVKMFGYSSMEEILQLPSAKLYANPKDRQRLIGMIDREGSFANQEVEFVRKDGSHFWGLASSLGIQDAKTKAFIYFDGAITDITERKRMEQELQSLNEELEQRIAERTAELRAANEQLAKDIEVRARAEAELLKSLAMEKELGRLKSNFVSMVSHEFRTPLGIIMSSAEILERYFERLRPEQRKDQLQSIHKSVRRMASLMEEVLLLAKVEAGKMEYKPVALDLAGFCRRVKDEVESATERRCPIVLREPELGEEALGDESLLRHIFTNLLANAVKYSRAGAAVRFEIEQRNGDACFRVEDEGAGIPAGDQAHLFKAFYRGQNVTHLPGTGLGLVIVKRCVDLHGGRISFVSTEGRGTTFTVTLPLFRAKQAEAV
jgi:PAS domain S-box-containing protein